MSITFPDIKTYNRHGSVPRCNGFSIRNTPPTKLWTGDMFYGFHVSEYDASDYRLVVLYLRGTSEDDSCFAFGLLDVKIGKVIFAHARDKDMAYFRAYRPEVQHHVDIKCPIADYYEIDDRHIWYELDVEVYLDNDILLSVDSKIDKKHTRQLRLEGSYAEARSMMKSFTVSGEFKQKKDIDIDIDKGLVFATALGNLPGGMFYFNKDMNLALKTGIGGNDKHFVLLGPRDFEETESIAISRHELAIDYRYYQRNRIRSSPKALILDPVVPADTVFYLNDKRIGESYVLGIKYI